MRENEHFNSSYSSRRVRNRQMVEAYSAWIDNLITEQFWQGWMVTFMFEEMHLSEAGTKAIMQKEVNAFFRKLCTRFHRKPTSAAAYQVIPRLIGCPDFPVFKHAKEGFRLTAPNHGLHYGSVLIHPLMAYSRACRLKEPLDRHVEENKLTYCNKKSRIDRIDLEPIFATPGAATRYTLKALENSRIGMDEVLILPRSRSEL
ncbi:hypothetical protein MKK84_18695 [Methylobacterium sp. E-065]|uniref:hypothetical protein n=1 Tax=Methylobacterium sp. E-065 TaxID=2836583 RepID=UPI001FBB331E|nr:hypothetical protein [Methylobacterium sp. E-065]MCJ2019440.1 hypothetical protein [Methylobacterium sp. E-065]